MTSAQALKEARRRWGRHAAVQTNPPTWQLRRAVGVVYFGLLAVKGQGRNWADAFADADRKGEPK